MGQKTLISNPGRLSSHDIGISLGEGNSHLNWGGGGGRGLGGVWHKTALTNKQAEEGCAGPALSRLIITAVQCMHTHMTVPLSANNNKAK